MTLIILRNPSAKTKAIASKQGWEVTPNHFVIESCSSFHAKAVCHFLLDQIRKDERGNALVIHGTAQGFEVFAEGWGAQLPALTLTSLPNSWSSE